MVMNLKRRSLRQPDLKIPYALKRILLQSGRARLPHGTALLIPGMEVNQAWLLRDGIVKHYHYNRKGEQEVYHFYLPGDLIVMEEEFLEQKRSKSYLGAIGQVILIPISYQQFLQGSQQFPQLLLIPLMQLMLAAKKRLVTRNKLLQCPAPERYQRFIKLFPAHLLLVKDIAAYLHLFPTTLSKIKSRY